MCVKACYGRWMHKHTKQSNDNLALDNLGKAWAKGNHAAPQLKSIPREGGVKATAEPTTNRYPEPTSFLPRSATLASGTPPVSYIRGLETDYWISCGGLSPANAGSSPLGQPLEGISPEMDQPEQPVQAHTTFSQ